MSGPTEIQSHWSKNLKPGDSFTTVPVAVGVGHDDFEEAIGTLTKYRRKIRRPNKDNFIDRYIAMEDTPEANVDIDWTELFETKPEPFTLEEKRQLLDKGDGVTLASDAFFPFADNIDRAKASGAKYIVQPGGSTRDDLVLEACNKYGMVMCYNGFRLFHH